jgi:hypothetical protein
LKLKDNEKFKDCDGNIFLMETRGVKELDGVYFKVKHLSDAFEDPTLQKKMIDDDTKYQKNRDYKIFVVGTKGKKFSFCPNDLPLKKSKKPTKQEYFATYSGVIRYLFSSHNKHAERFQSWAIKILFVHQMGSEDQKMKLGTDLLKKFLEHFSPRNFFKK